jgi:hypothetical protein
MSVELLLTECYNKATVLNPIGRLKRPTGAALQHTPIGDLNWAAHSFLLKKKVSGLFSFASGSGALGLM